MRAGIGVFVIGLSLIAPLSAGAQETARPVPPTGSRTGRTGERIGATVTRTFATIGRTSGIVAKTGAIGCTTAASAIDARTCATVARTSVTAARTFATGVRIAGIDDANRERRVLRPASTYLGSRIRPRIPAPSPESP